MRTTLNIDDELLERAIKLTGIRRRRPCSGWGSRL
jgi:hypothetical protein